MKQFYVILSLSVLSLSACQNKSSEQSQSTDVASEQVNNPATADNPNAVVSEYAVMSFKTKDHDFGDIIENQKVETTYEFVNTGKVDLLINDCKAACGCTVPDWPKTPIKPGGAGVIKVVFDSAGKSGMNTKIVTVVANIQEGTTELKFTANVRPIK